MTGNCGLSCLIIGWREGRLVGSAEDLDIGAHTLKGVYATLISANSVAIWAHCRRMILMWT